MSIHNFYALFIPTDNKYFVSFPDLAECHTYGDNLLDALDMAEEVLRNYLLEFYSSGRIIPEASTANSFSVPNGANLIRISVNIETNMLSR